MCIPACLAGKNVAEEPEQGTGLGRTQAKYGKRKEEKKVSKKKMQTEKADNLIPEKESLPEEEYRPSCNGCPYGRHFPCVGYCLKKIILEMKKTGGKEQHHAG